VAQTLKYLNVAKWQCGNVAMPSIRAKNRPKSGTKIWRRCEIFVPLHRR